MCMWHTKLAKRNEWTEIVSNRKQSGMMSAFDDEFDCPECGRMIDYDEYVNGSEPFSCPWCGGYILPYR